jgi:hypothetical protein
MMTTMTVRRGAALAACSYVLVMFAPMFQDGGLGGFKLPQDPGGALSAFDSRLGFIDFSEELAKPGVAVVFGALSKFTEGKKERIEGDLGIGNSKVVNMGTVFYKIECTGEIGVTDAFFGDVKGKSVAVEFDLQLAKLFDGKEQRQILTNPRHTFETPFTALWVLEKEKGKKNYRITRAEKFDPKNEKSADPATVIRKRAGDHYGINRRKADFAVLLNNYDLAKDKKDRENLAKKMKSMLENKPKWQLVETDTLANFQLASYEKRAQEAVEESGVTAEGGKAGEKPPQ